MEVVAGDDAIDREALNQHFGDKIFGGKSGERRIESEHNHAIKTHAIEDRFFCLARGQAEDDALAGEKVRGMRLEGQQGAWPAKALAKAERAHDHSGMAAMKAIEIADRHDRAFEPRRRLARIKRNDEGVVACVQAT